VGSAAEGCLQDREGCSRRTNGQGFSMGTQGRDKGKGKCCMMPSMPTFCQTGGQRGQHPHAGDMVLRKVQ